MGELPDTEALGRLVDWKGLRVVDVGCGPGDLARGLAQLGAVVLGIEPSPAQVALNRAKEPTAGVELIEGNASRIPRDDDSVDVVVFSRSLHHVPVDAMDGAIAEAIRVLVPQTGRLIVIEPDVRGQFTKLVRPFHDEVTVRARALEALARCADPAFESVSEVWFSFVMVYENFDAFVARMTGSTYNTIAATTMDTPEVRAAFEAGRTDDGYRFTNPNRVRLYTGPRP
jgi:ubiquinone/menaquinone biosynthesis C-methylase UbiE